MSVVGFGESGVCLGPVDVMARDAKHAAVVLGYRRVEGGREGVGGRPLVLVPNGCREAEVKGKEVVGGEVVEGVNMHVIAAGAVVEGLCGSPCRGECGVLGDVSRCVRGAGVGGGVKGFEQGVSYRACCGHEGDPEVDTDFVCVIWGAGASGGREGESEKRGARADVIVTRVGAGWWVAPMDRMPEGPHGAVRAI